MSLRPNNGITILAGAFIFMIFALYNGYPLIMWGDTSTYLESAFDLKVPDERPVFYGIFIRFTSLGATIWSTVFIQCMILSYVCIRFIKHLLQGINNLRLLVIILLISLATIAGWYAGQIMPDIFSPILFLSIYIYLQQKNTIRQKILLLAIIFLSIIVHNSHYVIASIFIVLILIGSIIKQKKWGSLRNKAIHLGLLTIIAWASLLASNKIAGNGVTTGRATHVFLMGKLAESGVLKTYLDKACPIKDYKICAYKDNISPVAWGFVWDTDSPVFKVGGWDSSKEEYTAIIVDIISQPQYWPILAYKSIEATLRQVVLLNIDEAEELPWRTIDKDHRMYTTFNRFFPHEINEFMVTKQNQKTLNIKFYDEVYVIVFLLSTIIVLLTLKGEEKKIAGTVYLLLIVYIFINAFATATFGNVLSRLNSRTIWLLPMVNIIFIYRYITCQLSAINAVLKNHAKP